MATKHYAYKTEAAAERKQQTLIQATGRPWDILVKAWEPKPYIVYDETPELEAQYVATGYAPTPESQAARLLARKRWEPLPLLTIQCAECNKPVQTKHSKRQYCGNTCVQRALRKQRKTR
jgi:hypothetical protein